MFIQQSDLFRDLNRDVIRRFMEAAEKETIPQGTVLFHEGEPATHFYVLLKGKIQLSLEGEHFVAYLVSHPGEVFGWSSLLDRPTFSATATTLTESRVVRIPGDRMREVLESDPESAMKFYRRLAKTLGTRLLRSYEAITSVSHAHTAATHGTGQILAMGAPH